MTLPGNRMLTETQPRVQVLQSKANLLRIEQSKLREGVRFSSIM